MPFQLMSAKLNEAPPEVKTKKLMSGEKVLSSAQCRAARAMLDWNREELAAKSGVSRPTLADFETGKRQPYDRTLADIRRAFEDAGLVFIAENGGGAGIRFREPEPEPPPARIVTVTRMVPRPRPGAPHLNSARARQEMKEAIERDDDNEPD